MPDHTSNLNDIKEWDRNTVADGRWLNENTIIPIKNNLSRLYTSADKADNDISALSAKIDELNIDAVSAVPDMYESDNKEKLAQVQAITGIIRIDESNPHKLVLGF